MPIIYWKDGTQNVVPQGDVSYWRSQGWYTPPEPVNPQGLTVQQMGERAQEMASSPLRPPVQPSQPIAQAQPSPSSSVQPLQINIPHLGISEYVTQSTFDEAWKNANERGRGTQRDSIILEKGGQAGMKYKPAEAQRPPASFSAAMPQAQPLIQPAPVLPATSTEQMPRVAQQSVPQKQTAPTIPFRAGLTNAQKQSISTLIAARPSSAWNATDIRNWQFATNNAPLPTGAFRPPQGTLTNRQIGGQALPQQDVSIGVRKENAQETPITGITDAQTSESYYRPPDLGGSIGTGAPIGTSLPGQMDFRQSQVDALLRQLIGEGMASRDTKGMETIQNAILGAQRPSEEETEAMQRLRTLETQQANLGAGLQQGVADVRGQPIAQHFLTGQEAALERQSLARMGGLEAMTLPIKTQLANIQARRSAALDVAKTKYEFGKETKQEKQRELAQALELAKFFGEGAQKPVEVSQGATLVDPMTGKVVYQAPTKLAATEVKESGGIIYERQADGTWKSVAGAAQEKLPPSAQEYEYAKKRGYKGTYEQYQNEDANRKRSISNTYIQGGITKDQFNRLNTISDNARQDENIKTFPAIRASFETARSASNTQNSAGDIVLMRMLAKITDPTTGVREEEYRTFQSAIGTLPRFGLNVTTGMVGKGQLTDSGRKVLLKQVTDIYNQRQNAYQSSVKFFGDQAKKAGGDLNDVVPVYVAPDLKKNIKEDTAKAKNAKNKYGIQY